jgi:hypothetical protein
LVSSLAVMPVLCVGLQGSRVVMVGWGGGDAPGFASRMHPTAARFDC